jgi:ribonuclease HII
MPPHDRTERQCFDAGAASVTGIDEVGRGCWAGPVVAAAATFDAAGIAALAASGLVDDSKQLTAARRERARGIIEQVALGWSIGQVPAWLIDQIGILAATRLAMTDALLRSPRPVACLLVDAVTLAWPAPQRALIGGDATSLAIAAASILAKCARDRRLGQLDRRYPGYGFARHRGYGTAEHVRGLQRYGRCAEHRRSFRPVANLADASAAEG